VTTRKAVFTLTHNAAIPAFCLYVLPGHPLPSNPASPRRHTVSTPLPGIARIPLGADNAPQLPRNHHGDPTAPQTPDGRPYRYCWTNPDQQELVFADTADDLLGLWMPGYLEADPLDRLR